MHTLDAYGKRFCQTDPLPKRYAQGVLLILNVRLAKSFKISMSTTGAPPKLEGFPEHLLLAILGVGFRLHKPYPYSLNT